MSDSENLEADALFGHRVQGHIPDSKNISDRGSQCCIQEELHLNEVLVCVCSEKKILIKGIQCCIEVDVHLNQ